MNELTFVARLGGSITLRCERLSDAGQSPLIAKGDVEESQVDAAGSVRRCDIRLSTIGGRKLASGEVKRPELKEGRDCRNESLRSDARNKAIARGLPYYFTCNMARVVLWRVTELPGIPDKEVREYELAQITHSRQVEPHWATIEGAWLDFIDDLESRLQAEDVTRPIATSTEVLVVRNAINAIADEAITRVTRQVALNRTLAMRIRAEALKVFGFNAALETEYPDRLKEDLLQLLRFGAFVATQKLLLYRVLQDTGPKRTDPFRLDPLAIPSDSTDPSAIHKILLLASAHAIERSRDYETAFTPDPLSELLFIKPKTADEIRDCRVGDVWSRLQSAVDSVSWVAISQNLVGYLYEMIVDPQYRHELGQFYTPEDVVDTLVTYAVRNAADRVLDPAAGGGSFLRSAYIRKTALGDFHHTALESTWGCEITAFAAELSTITLATANTEAPAAYPRVVLRDFFMLQPDQVTDLDIPDSEEDIAIPKSYDAVVGNPPYISYRRITNHSAILQSLKRRKGRLKYPRFSGKSDEYVWFLVHATRFLHAGNPEKNVPGGRLSFVVSSALLFADYGVPLIQFLGQHYKIISVVDSMVERWFAYADTNAILLMLERCEDSSERSSNTIRFVRLRRRLANLLARPDEPLRRQSLEDLVELVTTAPHGDDDPRISVNHVQQGEHGGLSFIANKRPDDSLPGLGEGFH